MSDFEVSEDSSITIPIRNLIGMIFATGIVVMGYFALTERITMLERDLHLYQSHVEQNSEFRTTWAPPPEVQETVRLSHRHDIRLDYIEQRLSQFELEVDKAIDQQFSQ